ncbi:hypothetical protein BO82DRAFT_355421 [Aspergillus uvarum CBS 121591]|uniref:Uncharacterized protein n=1 Tax=Aspergillus uvarum CBS 121591 TaxID=1448315 RepID=A0A319CXS4_9EURO|nr:hypothetical protein BO82DRAFT_355421 [Aspergillus uvarum CBS 121591]PYH80448.1 hypothetical protein BO82DRAFT_355421 [Aspergillus uvarum CBS 121591]
MKGSSYLSSSARRCCVVLSLLESQASGTVETFHPKNLRLILPFWKSGFWQSTREPAHTRTNEANAEEGREESSAFQGWEAKQRASYSF